ncbi:MarR family transcriptional regulator [Sphingomonas sp. So64.6b]|nr:MarR family transcriptional regulator [Sphingomonas sp. So64.6b]
MMEIDMTAIQAIVAPPLHGEELIGLTPWESRALAAIVDAAEAGRLAPTADELQATVGCDSVSTTVNIVQRLEKRGLIRVERYQRSRRIFVVSTGKATAPVNNKTPHWRTLPRPRSLPVPALPHLRQRSPDLAAEIIRAAHKEGMRIDDFIAELVWAGWRARGAGVG